MPTGGNPVQLDFVLQASWSWWSRKRWS